MDIPLHKCYIRTCSYGNTSSSVQLQCIPACHYNTASVFFLGMVQYAHKLVGRVRTYCERPFFLWHCGFCHSIVNISQPLCMCFCSLILLCPFSHSNSLIPSFAFLFHTLTPSPPNPPKTSEGDHDSALLSLLLPPRLPPCD